MKIGDKFKQKSACPVAASPVKIAFLGDSVTHGCFEVIDKGNGNIDCLYDHEAVYHNRLKRMIETAFPNCPVSITNAGISGDTATGAARRAERDIVSVRPDLAVVCLGLNDVLQPGGLDAYSDGLLSIFQTLRMAEIETIFMTPNSMCTYACPQLTGEWLRDMGIACSEAQNDGKMDLFVNRARELCRQEEILLCDCYADWMRLRDMGADLTYLLSNYINHPTRGMHQLFAARLFETIFLS